IQGHLAPFISWFSFLGHQQNGTIKKACDVLLIHHWVQMELERHFYIDRITILPLAAQGKVGSWLRLDFFFLTVHFHIKTFGRPLWHSDIEIKFSFPLY